jgi:hypothetical protein
MNPIDFEQANMTFNAPPGQEDYVQPIRAFYGQRLGGSLDGVVFTVVCWELSEEDLEALRLTGKIYLSFVGGLPPHLACTSFEQAANFG